MIRTATLISVLILGLGCKGNKTSTANQTEIEKKAIIATWHLLTIENSIKTFTSNKDEVTPRRGFENMIFNADGTCSRTLPGPTDRPETSQGTWKWTAENELTVKIDGNTLVFQVSKLSTTRLELRTQD